MKLDRFTPLTSFKIIEPRWHDKKVLLKALKVEKSKNKYLKITFTQGAMEGDWVVDRTVVKKYKKESNGVIMCYVVPLSELLPLEIKEHSLKEVF